MSMIRVAAAAIAAGLFIGCTPAPKPLPPAPPPPAPTVSVDQARGYFKTANPLSSVGVVRAVRTDRNLVAVADLGDSVAIDDAVSIVGASADYPMVANGFVDKIETGYTIVQFTPGPRTPEVGDFVVRVPPLPRVANKPTADAGMTAPAAPTATPAAPAAPAPAAPAAPADMTAPAPAPAPTPAAAPAPAPSPTETPAPKPDAPKAPELNK